MLNKYIVSSVDENSVELKLFVNEELGRIRDVINTIDDKNLFKSKTQKVFEAIDSFKQVKIDSAAIEKILHLQQLAGEIQSNGN